MNEIYRAYSVLTEKSFDEGDAVVRGIATTPTPDRVSDIVVPTGAVFRTRDIKLHLYHNTTMPVGQVTFGKPTNKGIAFEARIPEVTEEGVVRDRVNEARHSLKYNLLSAVSIGFRALDGGVEFLEDGGLKFTSWEMIELSLTSVPANPEAIIQTVKSLNGAPLPRDIIRSIKLADTGERTIKLVEPARNERVIRLTK